MKIRLQCSIAWLVSHMHGAAYININKPIREDMYILISRDLTQCGVRKQLEIISTLMRQIGIPPPTVAPWQEALYKDRQSNRRVGVF